MYTVSIKRAPALCKGDRIRLIAPASPFAHSRFRLGVKILDRLGLCPVVDRSEFGRKGFLAGDDQARAKRLEQALMEEDTQAVWCIRGGYGSARLLSLLDLHALRRRPKVLIGFSDVTALLLSVSAPGGYVSIHGPVVTQLPSVPKTVLGWLMTLVGDPRAAGRVPLGKTRTVSSGSVHGFVLGGNLSVLTSLVGTPWFPELSGSILCIEDTGEPAYRLDRMFRQLLGAGVLKNVFGVVIGSLSGCKPQGRGRYSARAVLERAVAELQVPAISGADFGHEGRNLALPLGVLAKLDAGRGALTLLEPAVQGVSSRP